MAEPTFFWHDYETTGADSRLDRAVQFAGIRTNADLEPVAEPVDLYCQPPTDSLPAPQAVLITGITPQQAQRDGLSEAAFTAAVHDELATPGTCTVGYNSLRFDDEFTRQMLYRNFFDPYAREWQNGNSRWDLIDLARMCKALRPEGIEWPRRDDGAPSFRLEDLAATNNLQQERAHDALSDVYATLDLARLLKRAQPHLWDWYFQLRRKRAVFKQLDTTERTPVLHVSNFYPAERDCLSMIVPLATHPSNPNAVIVADLGQETDGLVDLDPDAIADRVFTPAADLPEDVSRLGLRTLHANRSPALAPLSVLKHTDTKRLPLDIERCRTRAERLQRADGLAEKVRRVYADADFPPPEDVELALYDGFVPDSDRRMLERVRATPASELASSRDAFSDSRYAELLFRYRARNWPDSLSADEFARWEAFRRERLTTNTALTTYTLDTFFAEIESLRQQTQRSGDDRQLLDQLEAWARQLQDGLPAGP